MLGKSIAEADQALFEQLQNIGAFTQPGMDIERRNNQPRLSDEEIYERLRNQGARWSLERNAWFYSAVVWCSAALSQYYQKRKRRFKVSKKQEHSAFQESLNVSETLTLMISVWIPISKNC